MWSNGHEEGIEGVDLGCGLRKVGLGVGILVLKPNRHIIAGLF